MALARRGGPALQPQPAGLHDLPLLPAPPRAQLHPAAGLPFAPGADRPWRSPHQPLQRLDGGSAPPAGLGAGSGVTTGTRKRPPLSPREAWISDGRQVLHFRPIVWDRWSQRLEITSGELLPDQPVPLLKRRWELSREEALRLWSEKRREGWQVCPPQWALPVERQPRDWPQVTSMGRSAAPPCF